MKTSSIDPVNIKDSVKLMNMKKHKERKSTINKSKPMVLPPIKYANAIEKQEWDIKFLPSDWVTNDAPSKVVQRLLKKRENEHRETIDEMKKQMAGVNDRIEEEIRTICDVYKKDSKTYSAQVDEDLKKIRLDFEKANNFQVIEFQTSTENAFVAYRIVKNKLIKMLANLKNLETVRTDVFKKILKRAYTKLNGIAHKLPFEIQEYFEDEIQNINSITLNNLRCYGELKTQLKLQLKNELRLWVNEICYMKDQWINVQKVSEFSKLNASIMNNDCKQAALQGNVDRKLRDKEEIDPSLGDWSPAKAGTEKLMDRVNNVESIVFEMDFCAQQLVGNFKKAVVNVFSNYFCDLNKLGEKIIQLELVDSSEVNEIATELCGPAVLTLERKYNAELENIEDHWSSVRQTLQCNLQDTLVFLRSLAALWDAHLHRINEAKDVVLKNLKNTIEENELITDGVETKINIAVDTLRQETDENELKELMCEIVGYLDELVKIYHSNCDKECKIAEKLQQLCIKEGEVLNAELCQFVSVFSKYEDCDPSVEDSEQKNEDSKQKDEDSKQKDEDSEQKDDESLLALETQMCKKQIQNLSYWKKGLWAIMEKYTETCQDENLEWANQWISSKCQKSELKLKTKLEVVHRSRYGRTKPIIYDVRLAELQEHRDRLKRHQAGVEEEISKMSLIYPAFETRYDLILEEYVEEVENIYERNEKATHAAMVNANMALLRMLTDAHTEKINDVNREYQKKCNDEFHRIFATSFHYLKTVRLFSEGGNFHPKETKSICQELGKLQKIHKKKIGIVGKENGIKMAKCLKDIRAKETNLQSILDKYKDELQYIDYYLLTLKNLHIDVKQQAFDLKLKTKALKARISNLQEKALNNVGVTDYLDTFTKLYEDVVEKFENIHHALSRTDPKNYICEKLVRTRSNISTTRIQSSTVTAKRTIPERIQKRIKKDTDRDTYVTLLFQTKPSKEDNFIGKMRYLIYESFQWLQNSAQEFYSKHLNDEFINGDRIHSSYEDFIGEVLPMHIYYHLQCELIWLEETDEFVKCIDDFSQFLQTYRTIFIKKYTQSVKMQLDQFCNNISSEIKQLGTMDKNDFLAIHDKLKPLYGYPGNRAKLDELTKQMDELMNKTNTKDELSLQKALLVDGLETFKNKVKSIVEYFDAIVGEFNEKDFISYTLEKFEEILNYIENFLICNTMSSLDKIATSASQRLEFYKKNIVIPPQYRINLTNSFSKHSKNDAPGTSTDVDAFINDYEEKVREIELEIDKIDDAKGDVFASWRIMWDADLERIKKLYSVKYDLPKES